MATPVKQQQKRVNIVEVNRVIEWREWKELRLQEFERGTIGQQRIAALDRSKAWNFTPEEEVEFMLTPSDSVAYSEHELLSLTFTPTEA